MTETEFQDFADELWDRYCNKFEEMAWGDFREAMRDALVQLGQLPK